MKFTVEKPDDGFAVLHALMQLRREYGVATVLDFKNLVGKETTYDDVNWGWTSDLSFLSQTNMKEDTVEFELHEPVSLAGEGRLSNIHRQLREVLGEIDVMLDDVKKTAAELNVPYTSLTDNQGKLLAKDLLISKAMILSTLADRGVKHV